MHAITRRGLILLGAGALLLQSRRSYAIFGVGDVVFDPSALQQQITAYALSAKEYALKLESYVTQLGQYKLAIQQAISLPVAIYNQATQLMAGVQSVTQLGSLLTGNSGSIIQRLNSLDGYTQYIASLGNNLERLPDTLASWNQQLGNSFSTLGHTFGVQQNDLSSQAALLQAAQQQAATAGGQVQAIQSVASIGAANANVLMQVEQTLIASSQATAQWQEAQADRQAIEDAETQKFWNVQPLPMDGNRGFQW